MILVYIVIVPLRRNLYYFLKKMLYTIQQEVRLLIAELIMDFITLSSLNIHYRSTINLF